MYKIMTSFKNYVFVLKSTTKTKDEYDKLAKEDFMVYGKEFFKNNKISLTLGSNNSRKMCDYNCWAAVAATIITVHRCDS
jgi:hypothetical protein